MEQNRCLLDVIDNPQLLQSFLESESSAETNQNNNNNNSNSHQQSFTEPQQSNDDAIFDKEALVQQQSTTFSNDQIINSTTINPPINQTENQIININNESSQLAIEANNQFYNNEPSLQNSSAQAYVIDQSGIGSLSMSTIPNNETDSTAIDKPNILKDGALDDEEDLSAVTSSVLDSVSESITTSFDNEASNSMYAQAPELNNNLSSYNPNLQYENNDLLPEHRIILPPSGQSIFTTSAGAAAIAATTPIITSPPPPNNLIYEKESTEERLSNFATTAPSSTSFTDNDNISSTKEPNNEETNPTSSAVQELTTGLNDEAPSQQPSILTKSSIPAQAEQQDTASCSTTDLPASSSIEANETASETSSLSSLTNHPNQDTKHVIPTTSATDNLNTSSGTAATTTTKLSPSITQPAITTIATTQSTASTTATTSNTTTTTTTITTPKASGPVKRAPAKRSAPRSAKGKKAATAANTPTTQAPTIIQNSTIQSQYTSSPMQQPMMYTSNNSGIRQPALLATSPMGQTITGIPQQQRVIQIQTANGPMYFAIAPGPALGTSPMMNQQQSQQQPQQPGMQSQQFTQQQVCFQPNSNVMINRPQLTSPSPNQQQPTQPRLAAPIMAGQTLAISNQQNPQQQHIVLPSSQPMMMPRMPNQLILNRPPGQLLPGQQQFIQIQTPNGPMLLALPTQQQQQQTMNNNTMIDYNNQIQQHHHQQQQQLHQNTSEPLKPAQQTNPAKQVNNSSSKSMANSKPGLDLGDLLLDCGILPEDKMSSTQSPNGIKTSQSPVIQQMNTTPLTTHMPPMTNSPMPSMDSSPLTNNTTTTATNAHPHQAHPSPIQNSYVTGQPMQQQPIRITFGPDGQMIMQPTVYGAIRPVLHPMGQTHLSTVPPNSIVPSVSPMMTLASTPSSVNNNIDSSNKTSDNNNKKSNEGKTTTKKSRSKKSDKDKFPTLKTPKILQQQQKQQQQQQQQQQQMQTLTVLPMTVMIGDQNKTVLAQSGSDVKPNVAQLASGQQVSLAKIVTPVMQTASLQPLTVNSNLIQSSIPNTKIIATTTTHIGQNQSTIQNNSNSGHNTQIASDSVNSINSTGVILHQQHQIIQQNSTIQQQNTTSTSSTSSQMCPSGNVTTNLIQTYNKSGTVETNPHISSSLMPTTISLSVDTPKIEQNGLKVHEGQTAKGIQHQLINSVTGQPIGTLVLHHTQPPPQNPQNQLNQAQELARKLDLRAQSILNQLAADQNSALNPQQTKQSFKSFEDACKRLLRYHIFDTETVDESHMKKVDGKFEVAAESLISRKKAIYEKYRILILKQSMKTVPSSEEVMLDQIYVNDEHTFLKKERELFREYEAHLESITLKQSRTDSHNDCASEYFAFGEKSPKRNNQDDLTNSARPREVDEWLLNDKWGDSRYPSVEDNEAATAIESILNEELS